MLDLILTEKGLQVSDFGNIRFTGNGWLSVFDLIQVCAESTDRKYPHYTWERMADKYPEVSAKCSHFKFKGRGQKETPICDKETALEIIGLLPGAAGKKYRAIAAKLVLSYLENPESLAELAVERMEKLGDIEGLKRHQTRLEGKIRRFELTSELKDRGVSKGYEFANITNGMTKDVLGKTASQIKTENNVKSARDAMEEWELAVIGASEFLAKGLMIKNASKGFKECNEQCRKASKTIKESLN